MNSSNQPSDCGLQIALYQPDIPGNTGTIMRMAACLNLPLNIIEPAGFRMDDRSLKRAGMDYLEIAALERHACWQDFLTWVEVAQKRLVLLTTKSEFSYTQFEYSNRDVLLLGRESAGVPAEIHEFCNHRITIPMAEGARSLNIAMATAMVSGEAIRQVNLKAE